MRLCTRAVAGEQHPGLLIEGEVLDLLAATEVLPEALPVSMSVRQIIEAGLSARERLKRLELLVRSNEAISDRLRKRNALTSAADTVLAPAISNPGMVLAAGLNYRAHLEEMNTPMPTAPYAFNKSVAALIGSGQPIVLPAGHEDMVDWEGEFCAVIGVPCHNVPIVEALDFVAGYTLINDVSARDWAEAVFASSGIMGPITSWETNLLGKQFPTFCPLGPYIVTADDLPDPANVHLMTKLNGVVMQDANTSDLVFSVAELVSHYSRFYELRPGDVISTGSPAGVGFGRSPKVFMHAGDTIEVEVALIGSLRNAIISEGNR